ADLTVIRRPAMHSAVWSSAISSKFARAGSHRQWEDRPLLEVRKWLAFGLQLQVVARYCSRIWGMNMRVADVMSRNVVVVSPQESLRDAASRMDDLYVGALPVCDGNRLV